MKKVVLTIILIVTVICLGGCKYEDVKKIAVEDIKVFYEGDIAGINHLVFGASDLSVDEEIAEYFENESNSTQGVLANIFEMSSVSIIKADDKNVEFKVVSPNMENVFAELQDKDTSLTEELLLQYINQYANNAEKKEFIVSIPYTKGDDGIKIDYKNELFINAITGGLIDAYNQLYIEALNEYKEGVSEKWNEF